MAESVNLALIRRQYANAGNRAVAHEVMAPDVVWDIAPGFPLGGVHTGLDSVLGDFLAGLGAKVAGLSAQPQEFFEDTDGHVIVLGHYAVRSRSGQHTDARFVHIWTVRGNHIVALRQVADSHIIHQTLTAGLHQQDAPDQPRLTPRRQPLEPPRVRLRHGDKRTGTP